MKNQEIYDELKRQKQNQESDLHKIKSETGIIQSELVSEIEGIIKGLNIAMRIVSRED